MPLDANPLRSFVVRPLCTHSKDAFSKAYPPRSLCIVAAPPIASGEYLGPQTKRSLLGLLGAIAGIKVPSPVVVKAQIPMGAIFTVIVDRNESEVVLDPTQLAALTPSYALS